MCFHAHLLLWLELDLLNRLEQILIIVQARILNLVHTCTTRKLRACPMIVVHACMHPDTFDKVDFLGIKGSLLFHKVRSAHDGAE